MAIQQSNQPRLAFTLGGRTVRTSKSARHILTAAIRDRKDYLVPQARSVVRKLQAAGQ